MLGRALWDFSCTWWGTKGFVSKSVIFLHSSIVCDYRGHQLLAAFCNISWSIKCCAYLQARLQIANLANEIRKVLSRRTLPEEDKKSTHTQAYFAEAGDKSASDTHFWQSQPFFLIVNFWSSHLDTFCVSEARGREKKFIRNMSLDMLLCNLSTQIY